MSTPIAPDQHMMTIGIREATDADLPSILEIVNREIVESPYLWSEHPKTLEERREWFAKHQEADQPVIVAVDIDSARVVGWASLSTFRAASGYRFTAEVSVYVARDAHRRGIGRLLVNQLHHAAELMGLRSLVAVIDAANANSVGLFKSLGYVESGLLDNVGRKFGEWRSEVFMVRSLDEMS